MRGSQIANGKFHAVGRRTGTDAPYRFSTDEGPGFVEGAGGLLAESFGPETVAVAVFGFSVEANVAAARDFFLEGAQIGAQFFVADDTQFTIFEGAAKGESELFFQGSGEGNAFDLPAEALFGALVQLDANAAGVDGGALELRQRQETVKVLFDLTKRAIVEIDAQAIPGHVPDSLADVEHAKVFLSCHVHAQI